MIKRPCNKCKKDNTSSNKFCIYCGTKLIKQDNLYDIVLNTTHGLWIALLSKVAKSDGIICKKEAEFMSKMFDKFIAKENNQNRDIYRQIVDNEKDDFTNINKLCEKLIALEISNIKKIEIIKSTIALAYEDSEYNKEEENLIIQITHALKLNFLDYQKIEKNFQPKSNENNKKQSKQNTNTSSVYLSIDECYSTLKVSKNCSDIELKKSYRSLAKTYHTDILKSKELPEDILYFAEEKLKSINFAYEKLKKYRSTNV